MANRITAIIDVVADKATREVKSFRQAVGEADGAVGKMKAAGSSLGTTLRNNSGPALAAAGAAAFKLGQQAVAAASSLEESQNAVQVAFGDSSDAMLSMGETADQTFGLSQRAFNEAAVAMSSFAETVAGEGGDVVATMGDMIGRATDFASVYNLEVEEALQVFQSTLAGQTEPIRRYGKDISAAAVELHALEKGLISNKSEMTEAIKVQARFSLLMEETADTAGDFANTQDSLANQSRVLTAQMEDLQAEIGKHLVPAVADAVQNMNEMLEVANDLGLVDLAAQAREWSQELNVFNPNNRGVQELRTGLDALTNSTEISRDEMERLRDVSERYGEEAPITIAAVDSLRRSNDEAAEATRAATKETELKAYWSDKAADADDEAAEAVEKLGGSTRRSAEQVEDLVDALKAQKDAADDMRTSSLSLADADLDLRNSVAETDASIRSYNTAMKEGTGTALELAQQARDTEGEILAQADAAVELATAQAEANGGTVDAATQTRIYRETLEELQAKVGEGSPLHARLQEHIDRLNAIPGQVSTVLQIREAYASGRAGPGSNSLDGFGGTGTPASSSGPGGASHTGSRRAAGETVEVIPGQVFTPDTAGRVHSPSESARMLGSSTRGAAPNVTIVAQGQTEAEIEAVVYRVMRRLQP